MENDPVRGMPDRPEESGAARPRPTLGFILANIHIGTGRSLWPAIVRAAEQHDANLICFPGGGLRASAGFEAQRNAIYDLVNPESVDGLISWSSTLGGVLDPAVVADFHNRFKPLPLLSLAQLMADVPTVLVDSYNGMRSAIVHLIEVHGYRRLAFIRGPERHFYAQERFRAYTETLQAYGIPFNEIAGHAPDAMGGRGRCGPFPPGGKQTASADRFPGRAGGQRPVGAGGAESAAIPGHSGSERSGAFGVQRFDREPPFDPAAHLRFPAVCRAGGARGGNAALRAQRRIRSGKSPVTLASGHPPILRVPLGGGRPGGGAVGGFRRAGFSDGDGGLPRTGAGGYGRGASGLGGKIGGLGEDSPGCLPGGPAGRAGRVCSSPPWKKSSGRR